MIVTHTRNAHGHRRVYLGGKASVECWIEPAADGVAWSFHMDTAQTVYPLPDDTLRDWAKHMLLELASAVGALPQELKAVPFERIAALHVPNPADYRRVAVPRRKSAEHGFMATAPDITRPHTGPSRADFDSVRFRR